ncbi:DNA-directed DNA polymerase [Tanacetum coccineum]
MVVKLLTKDLGLADGHGITFISDGHKGLIQAVRTVVPRVEHRLCARHIYANFNKIKIHVHGQEHTSKKEWIVVTPPNLGSSGMLNIRGRYFIDQ